MFARFPKNEFLDASSITCIKRHEVLLQGIFVKEYRVGCCFFKELFWFLPCYILLWYCYMLSVKHLGEFYIDRQRQQSSRGFLSQEQTYTM